MADVTLNLYGTGQRAGDIIALEAALREARAKSIPYAIRNALNDAAFDARREAVGQMEKNFTLRNQYVKRSLWVTKATGLNIPSMAAYMGSGLDFMADQETGWTKRSKGRVGIPKPTVGASGETGKVRLRPVRPSLRWGRLKLDDDTSTGKPVPKFSNPRQAVAVAIAMARRSKGKRMAFIPFPNKPGIYRVQGRRKGRNVKATLFPIYIMDAKEKNIHPTPWMRPAVDLTVTKVPEFYALQLDRELAENLRFRELRAV